MTKDIQDAIRILSEASHFVARDYDLPVAQRSWWWHYLARAIRHLAYPDRDVYPKTRKGTKGAPIVRR